MSENQLTYRDSVLSMLELLGSSELQMKFENEVHNDDYISEYIALWFDDLAMESIGSPTELMKTNFSKEELKLLSCFTDTFDNEIDGTLDWENVKSFAAKTYKEINGNC